MPIYCGLASLHFPGQASLQIPCLEQLQPVFMCVVLQFPVRTIIDEFSKVPDTLEAQEKLCIECIDWCKTERRTYLRQRLQSKLAGM